MPKALETIRDFIVERQEDLAREIVERHWKLRPAWNNCMGKKGWRGVWKMPVTTSDISPKL